MISGGRERELRGPAYTYRYWIFYDLDLKLLLYGLDLLGKIELQVHI